MRRPAIAWVALAGSLAVASPALAQGHGNAFGHYKSTVSSASSPTPSSAPQGASIAGTGVRNFGSWLDDASVLTPGEGFVSFGFSLFKTPVYREVDLPSIDSGFAVNRKLQVGMSVPYSLANEPGSTVARGFGDVYLSGKYQVRAPSAKRLGFAVIPLVEVLSVAPPSGSRVQWALPVSVEQQHSGWRLMGTGGYFSRGALFGSGAVEFELSERAWATGSLSHSYSLKSDELSAALGLTRARTDVSGGLTWALRPDIGIYGSLGRTISSRDNNSASLVAAVGVSFGVTRP